MSRFLTASLVIAVVALATPDLAEAGKGGKGGRSMGGNNRSSFKQGSGSFSLHKQSSHKHHNHHHKLHFHHPHFHHQHHTHHKHHNYHRPAVVHYAPPVIVHEQVVEHCVHPHHCYAYVQPGDTLHSIVVREYGDPQVWQQVAKYNSLDAGAPLPVGQQIQLPSIYPDGRLVRSTAPAPMAPAMPSRPQSSPAPAQTVSNQAPVEPTSAAIRQAPPRSMPTFATGSELVLDGQAFGEATGEVRLMVGPIAMPVRIASWNATEVAIQLPAMELTGPADAELRVTGADGKMITRSPIRIVPAQTRLAISN